jgi:hypothetical protein
VLCNILAESVNAAVFKHSVLPKNPQIAFGEGKAARMINTLALLGKLITGHLRIA